MLLALPWCRWGLCVFWHEMMWSQVFLGLGMSMSKTHAFRLQLSVRHRKQRIKDRPGFNGSLLEHFREWTMAGTATAPASWPRSPGAISSIDDVLLLHKAHTFSILRMLRHSLCKRQEMENKECIP